MDEPGFAVEYAKMCKHLNQKQVKENDTVVNFRKLLITRCQTEFQKDYMEGIDPEKLKEEVWFRSDVHFESIALLFISDEPNVNQSVNPMKIA